MTSGPFSSADLQDLARRLPPLDRLALFLDVDGTLVGPHHDDRQQALTQERIGILQRLLERTGGATAILTGREIIKVDEFFHPLVLPVAGMQGVDKRFPDGERQKPALTLTERRILTELAEDVRQLYPRVVIEEKAAALAFVYPEHDPLAGHLYALAMERAGEAFRIMKGRVAIDVVPMGADKGDALHVFMRHPAFAGRIPVHFGDDVPDESAFAATQRHGGFGVTVSRRVAGIDAHLLSHNDTWDLLAILVDGV